MPPGRMASFFLFQNRVARPAVIAQKKPASAAAGAGAILCALAARTPEVTVAILRRVHAVSAGIGHALESVEDRLREREADLKQAHKQTEDLTKQLDHPFEHEERVTVTTKRQQEIVEALDITKNQASAKLDAGAEQSTESGDDTPQQTVRSKRANAASVAV